MHVDLFNTISDHLVLKPVTIIITIIRALKLAIDRRTRVVIVVLVVKAN